MPRTFPLLAALTTLGLAAASLAAAPVVPRHDSADVRHGSTGPEVTVTATVTDDDGNEMTSLFVTSFDGTQIDVNVCRPAAADASAPVPVVLHSHGWGGQKANCLGRAIYFQNGIAFASMTQRGNGSSTGQNNIMDPDLEGRDIVAVIDHLASLDWVAKDDGPGGIDPVLGGLGGSYGGGFQWVGAFTDQWLSGEDTRFNSLNVGNTWYDLRHALAPNDVLRTVIVGGLYAGGVQNNGLAPWVHAAMGTFIGTGLVTDLPAPGADFATELHQHGPVWFVEQGQQLDIPVRLSQGAGDMVFNLNESIHAFEDALTPRARERSILANHHAGHGVPPQVPSGPLDYTRRSGDTCDLPGDIEWFRATLLEEERDLGPRLPLRTIDGRCFELDEFPTGTALQVATLDGAAVPVAMRGAPRLEPLLSGPATVAGAPVLSFTATNTVSHARLFWGLAIGTSPDDAKLVDAQWMPTQLELPGVDQEVTTELGATVFDLAEGETLYLVVSPHADQFAAHASRAPGVIVVDDVTVTLPLVD